MKLLRSQQVPSNKSSKQDDAMLEAKGFQKYNKDNWNTNPGIVNHF